ncbi:hypothetical protein GGS24DRAFT_516702 [Hypoxylon argillaceum]|nr:hypothetical protein GGS24DRAFT_516702 [Hypoxylon argillaceum]
MSPLPQQQPFTCTFCWHVVPHKGGGPSVLGPSARLACDACARAIVDLAICWVCGELVFHAEEEMFNGDEEEEGRQGAGRGMGRQILDIPMCVDCVVECEEDDDGDGLLKKALDRIDGTDGGLSRRRWMALKNSFAPPVTTTTTTRLSQLGGDSSMDMPASPDGIPPLVTFPITNTSNVRPPSPSPSPSPASRDGIETPTLAKLHYRRAQNPRFAELECTVPLDSAIYVSIRDPLNAPAFKPCPAKPVPEWMRLLPGRDCPGEARPRSVLDAHFPPASAFARTEAREKPEKGEIRGRTRPETEVLCPRFTTSVRPFVVSPPSEISAPLRQRGLPRQQRTSSASLGERFRGSVGSSGSRSRSASPVADFRFPSPPVLYKRPSVVADEPLRRPSSRLMGLREDVEDEYADGHGTASASAGAGARDQDANAKLRIHTTASGKMSEGKGKSVAWDKTVAGGESTSESRSRSGSESSCESYERKPRERGDVGLRRDTTPPGRRASPLAAVWQRVVKAKTKTPPAQSNEFIDLYAAGKTGETARLESLAVPGRRRGREIGKGGRVCSKCGNWSDG